MEGCATENIFTEALAQALQPRCPIVPGPPAMLVTIGSEAAARDLELVVYEQTEAFGKPPAPAIARLPIPSLAAGEVCELAVPRYDAALRVAIEGRDAKWTGVVGYVNRTSTNAQRTALVGASSLRGRVVAPDGRPAAVRVWIYPAWSADRPLLRWENTNLHARYGARQQHPEYWEGHPFSDERVDGQVLPCVSAIADANGEFEVGALPGDAALVHVRFPMRGDEWERNPGADAVNDGTKWTRDSMRWVVLDSTRASEVDLDLAREVVQPLEVVTPTPAQPWEEWGFEVQMRAGERWAECFCEQDFPGTYHNSTQVLPPLPRLAHRIRAIRGWDGAGLSTDDQDLESFIAQLPHSPWVEFVPGASDTPLELHVTYPPRTPLSVGEVR